MLPIQLKSERGGPMLAIDGYLYRKKRILATGKVSWECNRRRDIDCKARLETDSLCRNPVKFGTHEDAANPTYCEAAKVKSDIREGATSTTNIPSVVVSNATGGIHESVAATLPSQRDLGRVVNGIRRREFPDLPRNPADLQIPDAMTKTKTGANFLLYDSGPGPNRIMIFSTARSLELVADANQFHLDGTFKAAPRHFEQLYTLHSQVLGKVVPLVFALLPNRTRLTYETFLRQLLVLEPRIQPDWIMIDYEQAMKRAIEVVFPAAQLRGCFFHFNQSLWRRIQGNHDMFRRYSDDVEFGLQVRHLAALAFRRPADVLRSYTQLRNSEYFLPPPPEMIDFLEYFERVWIGLPPRGQEQFWAHPLFPTEMWNVYNAVDQNWARTNNALEGWHHRFNGIIGCDHPNTFRFLKALIGEEDSIRVSLARLEAGGAPAPKRRKYVELDQRFHRILDDYDQIPAVSYLRRIAHNLSFS